MSKAIKFKNDLYLDTSGSVHKNVILKTWLQNFYDKMHSATSNPCLFRDAWWSSGSGKSLNNVYNGINFAYSNHGNPANGTAVTFSGITNNYKLQLASDYHSSRMYMRTKNGDNNTWNGWQTIANMSDLPSDSGWVDVPLNTSLVSQYDSNAPALRCRKFGPIVTVSGILKTIVAFTPTGNTSHRLATLPAGYRPGWRHNFVMQGSGSNRWDLYIDNTNGNMYICRYSNNTTTQNQVPNNAWLNVFATFMTG